MNCSQLRGEYKKYAKRANNPLGVLVNVGHGGNAIERDQIAIIMRQRGCRFPSV